jgi:two-component system alkaline phosphatase synthesis response regulator PhoP
MNERIFIVEDEAGLQQTLVDCLRARSYRVEASGDGAAALEIATRSQFELIVLDVMLPSMDGIDVCRTLRQRGVGSPILMLTARAAVRDRVEGLREGADDYLAKPFEMEELLARIEALLRRSTFAARARIYEIHGIEMDFDNNRISKGGRFVDLSERESGLLRYFVEHRGETLSREELLRAVWGYNLAPETRTVDVHVAWLRQKLEDDPHEPRLIATVHGRGYRFLG